MDSCEKHGWWEVNGQDACPSCEITLLRADDRRKDERIAEAERERDEALLDLKEIHRLALVVPDDGVLYTPGGLIAYHLAKLRREKIEALAQVAVLLELYDRVVIAEDPEEYLDDLIGAVEKNQICNKARAVLDRLLRVEALVEAVKALILRGFLNPDGGLEEAFPRHYVDDVRKALAAWEEGKA